MSEAHFADEQSEAQRGLHLSKSHSSADTGPQVFELPKGACGCPKALAPRGVGVRGDVTAPFPFFIPQKPHGFFVLTPALTSREAGRGMLGCQSLEGLPELASRDTPQRHLPLPPSPLV